MTVILMRAKDHMPAPTTYHVYIYGGGDLNYRARAIGLEYKERKTYIVAALSFCHSFFPQGISKTADFNGYCLEVKLVSLVFGHTKEKKRETLFER